MHGRRTAVVRLGLSVALALGSLTVSSVAASSVAAAAAPAPAVSAAPAPIVTPSANPAARPPAPRSGPAAQIAADYARTHRAELQYAPGDVYTVEAVNIGGGDVSYVAFSRKHRGMDVVGGDFVIAVSAEGTVLHANVAQTAPIRLSSEAPRISRQTAQLRADARIARVRTGADSYRQQGQRLVVFARDGRSSLAWETKTGGLTTNGPSVLTVYIDANTGTVLHQQQNVHQAAGTADTHHSGTVPVQTRSQKGVYLSQDPSKRYVSCASYSSGRLFADADNRWGNGNGSDVTTACAEALYVQQVQMRMVSSWLGRNGIDGRGDGFPVRVGMPDKNARFIADQDGERVEVGYDDDGHWLTSLDIVGHELGHALDLYTPTRGVLSEPETQEFVADVFGVATEFYARNSVDRFDYVIGERVSMGGPIRVVNDPEATGAPRCYQPNLADRGVHAAAGPGSLWFYLLAEGTNPSNGQPPAATCNGATLSGIGLHAATRLLYNAMLQKTSRSSYQHYRTYTLLAARNMYPNNCTVFRKVKAAWDAVRVPPMSSEPTCVSVSSVPTKRSQAGTAVHIPTSATGGWGAYRWSATGLPAGTSVNSSGVIGGRPQQTGTFRVIVSATDAKGATGATAFYWVVTAPPCWGQRMLNPGFEQGNAAWRAGGGTINRYPNVPARTGAWKAALNGRGYVYYTTTYQGLYHIPAGCTVTVNFYLWVHSQEAAVHAADKLTVKFSGVTKAVYSNKDKSTGYVRKSFTTTSTGGPLIVQFYGYEDRVRATSFIIDDVTLTLTPN